MQRLMLAFSGAIASGKSEICRQTAEKLGWPYVGFGAYIREYAQAQGKNPRDRDLLQRLGQLFVQSDLQAFVNNVLNQAKDWKEKDGIIVDGLRHAEVRLQLKTIAEGAGFSFKHIHIELDDDSRQDRAKSRQIEPAMLARYDSDLTEAQMSRILPAYADLRLDGLLPPSLMIDEVFRKFELKTPAA